MILPLPIPLEDELGDVLEKAMSCKKLNPEALSASCGIAVGRILDAIDYRSELSSEELGRIAAALELNEVGVCALGLGKYPLPEAGPLPFSIAPLHMPHGIGVVNAYIVSDTGEGSGILFDTGIGLEALEHAWPPAIKALSGVFLTHVEAEHAGGLCEVVRRFRVSSAYIPAGATAPCGRPLGEGESVQIGTFEIQAYSTPGHSAIHNCYLVRRVGLANGRAVLISGDLLFAGSAGGPYFCQRQLRMHLRRMLSAVPSDTLIAPGHGPMTTAENELSYNPFLA